MRWRIRLHLHPGPGFATITEMWCRWSRHAAISHGRRARPGMRFRHRLTGRTTDYAVRLGRGQWRRRAYARMEDQVLIMAAQRTGKSGIVADRILDHPGPVLATSTRADLYESTSGARALRGPVHVFNPQGVGGVPSSLAWDLLGPCKDLVMARRMATWLKVPNIGGDLKWFESKGDVALMALLWAAAVTGRSILDVYEWVQLHGHATCLEILAEPPGQYPADVRGGQKDVRGEPDVGQHPRHDRPDAVVGDPARPRRGGHPGAGPRVQRRRLHHLLRDAVPDRVNGDDDSPVTPLFRALASWVHYEAGLAGSKGRHKRLDPPLLMALDEVTQVCPVDLPVMLSDSAGKGVLITAVCHSMSQLEQRWGKHGAATVWACSGTKVLLGAISDPDTLEAASKLCGNVVTGDGKEAGGPGRAAADAARLAGAGDPDEPEPGRGQGPPGLAAAGLPARPSPAARPARDRRRGHSVARAARPGGRRGPGAGPGIGERPRREAGPAGEGWPVSAAEYVTEISVPSFGDGGVQRLCSRMKEPEPLPEPEPEAEAEL